MCIGKGLVAHGTREQIDIGRLEVFNKIAIFGKVLSALVTVKLSGSVMCREDVTLQRHCAGKFFATMITNERLGFRVSHFDMMSQHETGRIAFFAMFTFEFELEVNTVYVLLKDVSLRKRFVAKVTLDKVCLRVNKLNVLGKVFLFAEHFSASLTSHRARFRVSLFLVRS